MGCWGSCTQWSLGDAKEPCHCLHNLRPVAEVSFRSKQCPGQDVALAQALAHQSCQAGARAPKDSLHQDDTCSSACMADYLQMCRLQSQISSADQAFLL